jgi:hypothetical protein
MTLHANVRLYRPAGVVDRLPPKCNNDSKQSWNNSEGGDRSLVTQKLYVGTVGEESLMKA